MSAKSQSPTFDLLKGDGTVSIVADGTCADVFDDWGAEGEAWKMRLQADIRVLALALAGRDDADGVEPTAREWAVAFWKLVQGASSDCERVVAVVLAHGVLSGVFGEGGEPS